MNAFKCCPAGSLASALERPRHGVVIDHEGCHAALESVITRGLVTEMYLHQVTCNNSIRMLHLYLWTDFFTPSERLFQQRYMYIALMGRVASGAAARWLDHRPRLRSV
ncbi:hypothetical protein BaRGS_00016928 [Batillaria attramentaria]|uniref:Uncharacterized protein n=1 Tax=Batillaria attramentaria TaxID=370345 RepID=A0ABD0KXE8_9CAEN